MITVSIKNEWFSRTAFTTNGTTAKACSFALTETTATTSSLCWNTILLKKMVSNV